ncbi:MAG: tetratricopeptide repeat protein [Gammaproteobacteria bacterium]
MKRQHANRFALVATLVIAGCDAQPKSGDRMPTEPPAATIKVGLHEVPHPNPAAFKPDIRASLAPARQRFDSARKSLEGTALGAAFGKLGLHYQAHQQQEAAAACFLNARLLNPNDARWPYHLAVLREETGNFDDALALYTTALKLAPDNTAGQIRAGLLHVQLGDLEAAHETLSGALEVRPDSAAALAGLGDIARARNDMETAADFYRRALELDPSASQLRYRLGLVYRALGDIDAARASLAQRGERIARIKDPLLLQMQAHLKPPEHYIAQAQNALEANDLRRAAQFYSLGLAVEPTHAESLVQLGEVLLAAKQDSAAKQQFEKLIEAHPSNAMGHYYLGLCAVRAGDRPEALKWMQRALELDPSLQRARTAISRLAG